MKQQGITLIELLIALVIAVTIGVAAVALLDSAIGLEEQVEEQTRSVSNLDATFRQLSSGFRQAVQHRPVQKTFGQEPSIKLFENKLTLVQNGWQQLPNDERPRSSMRRVSYRLEQPCPNGSYPPSEAIVDDTEAAPAVTGCIVRIMQSQLDTDQVALDNYFIGETSTYNSEVQVQYLVENVKSWGITLLTGNADAVESVSEYPGEDLESPPLPVVGVEVLINHGKLGNIKRTFYVGHGLDDFQALPELES